jgi:uncharacterized repeat protein (TIGR03803 family)
MICIVVLFCAAAAIAAPAQSRFFTSLVSFDGDNGQFAEAPLIQGTGGNFYGTTRAGGASNHCDGGCGTVFKIAPAGTLATLYSFCSQPNCTDGAGPQGLIPPVNGYFYGTTSGYTSDGYYGYGTVFKMSLSGTLTTLYSFCAQPNCADGWDPSTLVQARDGNFYGTTAHGGDPTCHPSWGCGTIFRITPAGALTTLHTFEGSDGDVANSPLVQAADGNFYGTTYVGGAGAYCPGQDGCGTVFKITPDGTLTTLYNFCSQPSCTDGGWPNGSPLVQATDSNFYGTTFGGGEYCSGIDGCGTVYKITSNGTLTTLHSFDGADGDGPVGGVVQATDGNFYGTTANGGQYSCYGGGCGTVYKITFNGALTTLHSFDGPDGIGPWAGLVQGRDGNFYGTTLEGGANGDGTVFRIGVVHSCATCGPGSFAAHNLGIRNTKGCSRHPFSFGNGSSCVL